MARYWRPAILRWPLYLRAGTIPKHAHPRAIEAVESHPARSNTRLAKYERYRKLLTGENLDKVEVLIEYAESRGHTILELAFSWLLAHRVVAAAVIAGASSAQQLRANSVAAGWNLTPADLQEIDGLLRAYAGKATTT